MAAALLVFHTLECSRTVVMHALQTFTKQLLHDHMTVLSVRVRQSQKSRDSGTYCLIARGGGYGAETLPETAAPHRSDFYTIVRSDGTVPAEGSPHTSVCSKADMAIKRKYKLSCQETRHCTLDLRAFTPRLVRNEWTETHERVYVWCYTQADAMGAHVHCSDAHRDSMQA